MGFPDTLQGFAARIVYHKAITLWLLRDLRSLYSLASLVFGALDDIRKMWIIF